jgi:hypothetical protein
MNRNAIQTIKPMKKRLEIQYVFWDCFIQNGKAMDRAGRLYIRTSHKLCFTNRVCPFSEANTLTLTNMQNRSTISS